MLIQKIYRNKLMISMILLIAVNGITGCANENISDNNSIGNAAVIKKNNILYYYDFEIYDMSNFKSCDLYYINLDTGENKLIDHVCDENIGFAAVLGIIEVDGKLYYGKSTEPGCTVSIYSIDPDDPEPKLEGVIDEELGSAFGETILNDLRMFAVGNDVYVLGRSNLYRLNKGEAEKIRDDISSIYKDGNYIYYSLEKSYETGGIYRYNIITKKSKEIVSADKIREFNSGTVLGSVVYVRNIIVDDDTIYFFSADDLSGIVRYNISEDSQIEAVTKNSYACRFIKYKDKLYYKDYSGRAEYKYHLCEINTDGSEEKAILSNVYTFGICDDVIYYYTFSRPDKLELKEYNVDTE